MNLEKNSHQERAMSKVNRKMEKVAIIGAGAAGLSAARHCLDHNLDCDIFEQTGTVGGTWNYTDYVDFDENGIAVHSAMYKGLKTNAPKESMLLEGLEYPESLIDSYISQDLVLDYLQCYSNKFKLVPHIKFYTQVLKVDPQEDDTWYIEYWDVKTKNITSSIYDAVMVCNGHHKDTFIPKIPGFETFPGDWTHSHRYRSSESYKGKKVLLLGAGPSGVDISKQVATVADQVYISYSPENKFDKIEDPVISKPLSENFSEDQVLFTDGTSETIDSVIFCTGYLYTFPFMTEKCGIKVTDNCVHPLFKQVINIEHPTMAVIGLNFKIYPFPLFDIQSRFFLASLTGHWQLPSKAEMIEDFEMALKKHEGKPLRKFHMLGEKQGAYFDEMADLAGVKRVPPVMQKLFIRATRDRNLNDCFRIVDDETFVQIR